MVLLPLLRVLRACCLAGLMALAVFAAGVRPALAAYVLPPLPYPVDALAPSVDATTMTIHHDRHHGAYVANLNARMADHPELERLSLEDLQGRISQYPAAVRNNGGGHYNTPSSGV